MCTDEIDPDVLDVLIEERSRGRRGSPEEAKRKRQRQKMLSALDNAMRRAGKHGFTDALRNGGIVESSPAWKNAWAAYLAYQSRR
jgi:hypothetical protein